MKRSEELNADLVDATEGLRNAFNLWAAEPLGLEGARHTLESHAAAIVARSEPATVAGAIGGARRIAGRYRFFHWPLEFPGVFHRERPGFDVVVGNPPWNEITVEELAFYALRDPGLRGMPNLADRRKRIAELDKQNPDWRGEFEAQQEQLATVRGFFSENGGYQLQGVGDKDLYQLFCERYTHLVRKNGHIGVVLPRTAFLAEGAKGFRQWLFSQNTVHEIDILRNTKQWAFNITPQYRIALLAGRRQPPAQDSIIKLTGPSENLQQFQKAVQGDGVGVRVASLGSARVVPLMPSKSHAEVLAKLRSGIQFDSLQSPDNQKGRAVASHAVPYRELDETQQRALFSHSTGIPVWKGRSFDQYKPHGNEPAGYSVWNEVLSFVQQKRTRSPIFKRMFPGTFLANSDTHPINHCRIAFRDVARATDSRTVIACLVPPRTPLTNSAPYLVFSGWVADRQASILGTMNSLAFDWLARRYVELHLNFYVVNMLCFPPPDNTPWERIGRLASRLSCVDERFADFAAAAGVEYGDLTPAQRNDMRAEIDALVAHAYDLTADELRFIFTDFTENAVPQVYRNLVLEKFEGL